MFSQLPGTDAAIDAAAHRGYEAILMAIVLLACIGLVGMLIRWFVNTMDSRLQEGIEREKRLADRVSHLEQVSETTLLDLVKSVQDTMSHNTSALLALTQALQDKPCLQVRDRNQREIND